MGYTWTELTSSAIINILDFLSVFFLFFSLFNSFLLLFSVFLLSNRKTTMGFDRSGFVRQDHSVRAQNKGGLGIQAKKGSWRVLWHSSFYSFHCSLSHFHVFKLSSPFCPFWVCLSFFHIFFLVLFLFLITFDGFCFFISFPFFS